MSKDRERDFFRKRAAEAFNTLLAKKEAGQTYESIGAEACKAAEGLIKAIKEHSLEKFFEILAAFSGEDALRRILFADGNSEGIAGYLIRTYYIDKPDMLRSYAGDYHSEASRSTGQVAISRWYASKGEPPVIQQRL